MSQVIAMSDVMPHKHIPERTCIACRRKRPQSELLRWHKIQGTWQHDPTGRGAGRGVYLCPHPDCWQEKKLRRTFSTQAHTVAQQAKLSLLSSSLSN